MIKAVVFDYDGTLVDTLEQIHIIGNVTLKEFSLNEVSIENYKKYIGNGAKKLINRLILETFNPTEEYIEKVLFRYLQLYDEMQNDGLVIFDGITDLLMSLNNMQIKIAILSNKPERHVKSGAKKLFNEVEIDAIVGGEREFPLKPDPKSLLYVIENLSCDKSEVLYAGDGDADVLVAKNAGVTSVSALWGYRSKEELEKVGAFYFARTPDDIISLIDNLNK